MFSARRSTMDDLGFDRSFSRFVFCRTYSEKCEKLIYELLETHRKLHDESVTVLRNSHEDSFGESNWIHKDLAKTLNIYKSTYKVQSNLSRENAVRSLYSLHSATGILNGLKRIITEQCETSNSPNMLHRCPEDNKIDTSYEQSFRSFNSDEEKIQSFGISNKHVEHVQDGLKLMKRMQKLSILSQKRDALKEVLINLLGDENNNKVSLQRDVDSVGFQAESQFLQHRLREMRDQAQSRKVILKETANLKGSLKVFREKVAEKKQMLTHLRTENRQLSANLPTIQQLARVGKEALKGTVERSLAGIERLQSDDPMQRVLDAVQNDAPFSWKINAYGRSLQSLLHNAVPKMEIYQACCSQLGLSASNTSPDVILRVIVSLTAELRMQTEHAEMLRHILMILQEESCTTSKLQKNDSKVQEKVRLRIEPQLRQIRKLIEETKTNLSSCSQFLSDWEQVTRVQLPPTNYQVPSDENC